MKLNLTSDAVKHCEKCLSESRKYIIGVLKMENLLIGRSLCHLCPQRHEGVDDLSRDILRLTTWAGKQVIIYTPPKFCYALSHLLGARRCRKTRRTFQLMFVWLSVTPLAILRFEWWAMQWRHLGNCPRRWRRGWLGKWPQRSFLLSLSKRWMAWTNAPWIVRWRGLEGCGEGRGETGYSLL